MSLRLRCRQLLNGADNDGDCVSGLTRHAKRVRFYSTVDLVNALEHEKSQGRAGRIAMSLVRMDLVVLDELLIRPL